MFIKIDKSTFINTDQVTYFHEETGILKLTTGETFRVDQKYTDRLQTVSYTHLTLPTNREV